MAPESFQDTNIYDDEQVDEEREKYVMLRGDKDSKRKFG